MPFVNREPDMSETMEYLSTEPAPGLLALDRLVGGYESTMTRAES